MCRPLKGAQGNPRKQIILIHIPLLLNRDTFDLRILHFLIEFIIDVELLLLLGCLHCYKELRNNFLYL